MLEIQFSDQEFRGLLDHLGRPWKGYRKVRKGVIKRIRNHMRVLGTPTLDGYLACLRNPEEMARCRACLLVTITRFFRDRNLWKYLRQTALPLLADRFPEGLRVWSAGCACGEEPYGLAILWQLTGLAADIDILATDMSIDCLERARSGVFQRSSLREVPEEIRTLCFTETSAQHEYRIGREFGEKIRWQCHDIMDEPPPGTFHLIFLRNNLLTYHQGSERDHAFLKIIERLVCGGCLVIGSHEHIPPQTSKLIRDESCVHLFHKE